MAYRVFFKQTAFLCEADRRENMWDELKDAEELRDQKS